MPIYSLPNGELISLPEGLSEDETAKAARNYMYLNGIAEPTLGDLFGAGVDQAQSAFYSLGRGLSDEVTQNIDNPTAQDLAGKAWDFFRRKEDENTAESLPALQAALDVSENITKRPLTVLAQQAAINSPQMLGFMAAALAGGEVPAIAASTLYFGGTNLQRQRETKPGEDTSAGSALLSGLGQAALEDMFGRVVLPASVFGGKAVAEPAKKSFMSTAAKKMLQASAVGASTEVAQQAIERAQAGLPLTDQKAFDEYVDSGLSAMLLGGAAAPFTTFVEHKMGETKRANEKEAAAKVTLTDILKKQADDIPDTVTQPDGITLSYKDLEKVPQHVQYADELLSAHGFDTKDFTDNVQKLKAATQIIKNRATSLDVDNKIDTLSKALGGFKDELVAFKNEDPNRFLVSKPEELLVRFNEKMRAVNPSEPKISLQDALDKINQNYSDQEHNLKNSVELSRGDPTVDEVVAKQQFDENYKIFKEKLSKFDKAVKKVEKVDNKGVRPTLTVNEAKVRERLLKGVEKTEPQTFTDISSIDLSNPEDVRGIDPTDLLTSRSMLDDMENTLEDFARNEKTLLETKKRLAVEKSTVPITVPEILRNGLNPETQKSPIDFAYSVTPILDRVQPIADKITVPEATVDYLNNLLKKTNKQQNLVTKGIKTISNFKEMLMSDPITKIKTTIFTHVAAKYATPETVSLNEATEAFHFLWENTGLFSNEQKKKILKLRPAILKRFSEIFDVPKEVWSGGLDTPEAFKDLLGNIFNLYRNGDMTGFPTPLKTMMSDADKYLKNVNKQMRQDKTNNTTTLFPNFDPKDTEGLLTIRDIRTNLQAQQGYEMLRNQSAQSLKYATDDLQQEVLKEKKKREGDPTLTRLRDKFMSNLNLYLGILAREANKNPVMARFYALESGKISHFDASYYAMFSNGGKRLHEIMKKNEAAATQAYSTLLRIQDDTKPQFNMDGSVDLTLRPELPGLPPKKVKITNKDSVEAIRAWKNLGEVSLKLQEDQMVKQRLTQLGYKSGTMDITTLKQTEDLLQAEEAVLRSKRESKNGLTQEEKTRLENLAEKRVVLSNIRQWMERIAQYKKGTYVPTYRDGDYGVSLYYTPIDKATGQRSKQSVHVGNWMFQAATSPFNTYRGRFNKEEYFNVLSQIQTMLKNHPDAEGFHILGDEIGTTKVRQKLQGRNILQPLEKLADTFNPTLLTKNQLVQELNRRGGVTMLQDLSDLALIEGDQEMANVLENYADTRRALYGGYEFTLPSKRLLGSKENPILALNKFMNGMSAMLANAEYTSKIQDLKKDMERVGFFDSRVNPMGQSYKELADFISTPTDMAGFIRASQYFMSLGFNPSTALLQLSQLGTVTPGNLLSWTYNPIQAATIYVKSLKEIRSFISTAIETGSLDSENTALQDILKSKKITQEVKNVIKTVGIQYTIAGQFSHDAIRQAVDAEKKRSLTSPFLNTIKKGTTKLGSLAGYWMGITEGTARLTSLQAYGHAFQDPQIYKRALEQIKDNPKFQSLLKVYGEKGLTEKEVALFYYNEETFGTAGQMGRNPRLSSGATNALFPFSGFPMQQASQLLQMFRRSPRAGLATVMLFFLVGGLKGLPGFQNADEISKLLYSIFGDEPSTLEFEIRELMRKNGVDPEMEKLLSKGLFSEMAGIDIGPRVGIQLPIINEVLSLFQGNKSPAELTIQGGYLAQAGMSIASGLRGEDIKTEDLIPITAVKNIFKAKRSQEEPITTRTGAVLLPSQEGNYTFALKKALGFTPAEEAYARDARFYNSLNDQKPQLQSLRKQLQKEVYRKLKVGQSDSLAGIQNEINRLMVEIKKQKEKNGEMINVTEEYQNAVQKAREMMTGETNLKSVPRAQRVETKQIEKFYEKQ